MKLGEDDFPWMSPEAIEDVKTFLAGLPIGPMFEATTNWTLKCTTKLGGITATAFRHFWSTEARLDRWDKKRCVKLTNWLAHSPGEEFTSYVDE